MRINSRYNPVGGFADFWAEFRKPNPWRWPVLLVSVMLTSGIILLFSQESVMVPPAPPDVTYITTFEPGRTDEEIIASNIENQRIQDRLDELAAEREERRKELYRALGRATGLDVDAMEAEIAAEEARETAAATGNDIATE